MFETYSNTSVWLDFLQKSIEKVNAMFGLNIAVDYKFMGGDNDGLGIDTDNV